MTQPRDKYQAGPHYVCEACCRDFHEKIPSEAREDKVVLCPACREQPQEEHDDEERE